MPYQSGPDSLSSVSMAACVSPCAGKRPGRQQRRRQIGHRTAHRLGEVLAGNAVLLLLQFADADDQPRNAIVVIDRKQPVGKLARPRRFRRRSERREKRGSAVRHCADRASARRGNRWPRRHRRARLRHAGRPDSCRWRSRATTSCVAGVSRPALMQAEEQTAPAMAARREQRMNHEISIGELVTNLAKRESSARCLFARLRMILLPHACKDLSPC